MKCPCKNCLVIAICKNPVSPPDNLFRALEKCTLLNNYLEVLDFFPHGAEIHTLSMPEKFKQKLEVLEQYIPYKERHGDIVIVFHSAFGNDTKFSNRIYF